MKFKIGNAGRFTKFVALALSASSVLPASVYGQTAIRQDVMVVFDMSGSMWGQVDGVAKVEIARDAFGGLIADWEANSTRTGLIAYGHRRKGDCSDIELLAQPDAGADIASLVANLKPRGKTPLSDAVKQAAHVLKFTEEAATVVLLSDGVETCEADPCAVGAELEALGLDFTAHVIGFDIAEGDKAQLQCLASATGGQYFDAADASGLTKAMKGVVQATAIEAPEELRGQDFQTVTIRVRMASRTLALPEEITVFGNDIALGTLSDDTAVIPGLPIEMPFGPITLRVEGQGISGEKVVNITDQTGIIDLEVTGAEADYVIWREGQLPILAKGRKNTVLLKNTTGVDRASFYPLFLYPSGSTDKALRVKADNLNPTAGIYVAADIPTPATPGDYDLVPTSTDGTEYARIPISFAAAIDSVWQGVRQVELGGIIDALWAGSSNAYDKFHFVLDDKVVAKHPVSSLAQEDGFKLPAPTEPGLYELLYISDYVNNFEFKTTSLGMIAVGVPLPGSEAAVVDATASDPDAVDFDTEALEAETEAMGGEELPLLPVGDLHGDWQLVLQNTQRTIPLIKFQLSHAEGEPASTGGLVVEANPSWGFGPTGGFGDLTLTKRDDGGLLMTVAVNGGSTDYVMSPAALGWTTDISVKDAGTYTVLLVKAEDLAVAENAMDNAPVDHSLVANTENGERLKTPVTWTIKNVATDVVDTFQSDKDHGWDQGRAPGTYLVTATSGDLVGSHHITLGRGQGGANTVVLRPAGEGADLVLDVTFYCSEGETCQMTMGDIPLDFTLPLGWGAERPIENRAREVTFNMVTNTANGPFFATLNQPQRSADLGPCVEIINGTFCHDATDDPALLADVATLKQSLSFKATGIWLDDKRFNDLLTKLTGAAE